MWSRPATSLKITQTTNLNPSRLLLGWCQARPLHVVCAHNPGDREIIVVTVYEPDPEKWDSTFTRRRA